MGFGGAKNPLVDFQVATNKLSAQQVQAAASRESAALREQADILANEAEAEAIRRKREVEHLAGKMAADYAAGGVLIDGTPLARINEAVRLGDIEVNALRRQGAAQARLSRMQADSAERQGLESVLAAKAEGFAAKTQEDQRRRANRAGVLGSILKVGGGIASTVLRGW